MGISFSRNDATRLHPGAEVANLLNAARTRGRLDV